MAFFRSERGIGRGEVAESRIEAPFLVAFMLFCALAILASHLFVGDANITAAVSVSLLVVGITLVRVEMGVYVLIVAMLLSPEVDLGAVGSGERHLYVRYNDILIIIMFLGVLTQNALTRQERPIPWTPLNKGIYLFLACCLISTGRAMQLSLPAWNRVDAFFAILKIVEYFIIYFLVFLACRNGVAARKFLVFFLVIAVIVSVFGLFTLTTTSRLGAPLEKGGGEPNTFGGYLTVVMVLSLALFTQAKEFRYKALCFLAALFAFIPFLYTLSRASYLAMLVAVIVVGILAKKHMILVAVGVFLFLSPFLMPEEVKDRVNYTFQRGSGEKVVIAGRDMGFQVDKSTHERIYIWGKVRHNLKVWPFFGGGVAWESVLDSQFARVIIETGIFGLAAFLYLIYRMFRLAHEGFRWSQNWVARGVCLGVAACVIGLVVHGLGTITFLIQRIMEPFWFLLALSAVFRAEAIHDHARRLREEAARVEEEDVGVVGSAVALVR